MFPRVNDFETSLNVSPGDRITTVWVQAPDGFDPRVSQVLWLWIVPTVSLLCYSPESFEVVLLLALTQRFDSCGMQVTYEAAFSFDTIFAALTKTQPEETVVFSSVTQLYVNEAVPPIFKKL